MRLSVDKIRAFDYTNDCTCLRGDPESQVRCRCRQFIHILGVMGGAMKAYRIVCAVLVAALLMGGCVSRSKYTAAVADAEAAKTELEKTRAQKSALEQQVKTLKDLNAKLSADAELYSSELQRIKESREKEKASLDTRTKQLEAKVRDLTAQERKLRKDYNSLKRVNDTLKATVARYQKELKERQRAIETPGAPPPRAAAPAPAAPGAPAGAKVNINTASASDMTLYLGLTKDMADRVIANRPYKLRGELVSKNVVPKATFDVIKDKITTSP